MRLSFRHLPTRNLLVVHPDKPLIATAYERARSIVGLRQYVSGTKCLPINVSWSSYLFLFDRLGSVISLRGTFLYGIKDKICDMQFNRARRLLSDRTIYQGACLLSVALSILSRARE